MSGLPVPVVRYMIVCDEVWRHPARPTAPIIVGLTCVIHSSSEPRFPFVLDHLCAFLVLTEGRGSGQGQLKMVFADTDEVVWETPLRTIQFPGDPLHLSGVAYRVLHCRFPDPGLYHLQFWYDGQMLAEQPLLLTE